MLIKKSKMSGKLLGLDAINSNTLSNEFCKKEHKSPVQNKICKECYSIENTTNIFLTGPEIEDTIPPLIGNLIKFDNQSVSSLARPTLNSEKIILLIC